MENPSLLENLTVMWMRTLLIFIIAKRLKFLCIVLKKYCRSLLSFLENTMWKSWTHEIKENHEVQCIRIKWHTKNVQPQHTGILDYCLAYQRFNHWKFATYINNLWCTENGKRDRIYRGIWYLCLLLQSLPIYVSNCIHIITFSISWYRRLELLNSSNRLIWIKYTKKMAKLKAFTMSQLI